ncbi:MAG: hypothetical protein KF884_11450 [Fimbriimonadaceae bacterium]|nr:hypothetical protein [Fimbriimonadaceae bacterium]QYK58159.1 MAG: hypothetical protein KF884_11450 [Fimbriimonadaceae bacterium]
MKYYVIWADGQKFGPADVDTLTQWAAEGRINENTELESATTGARLSAASVPGILFTAREAVPPGFGQTLPPQATSSYETPSPESAPFSAPGLGGGSAPSPYATPDDGSQYVTYSWISLAVGLLCLGCIGTGAGIYFASEAKKRGNPNAQAPFVVNLIATALIALVALFWVGFIIIAIMSQ